LRLQLRLRHGSQGLVRARRNVPERIVALVVSVHLAHVADPHRPARFEYRPARFKRLSMHRRGAQGGASSEAEGN
jgi:hypothetical protein